MKMRGMLSALAGLMLMSVMVLSAGCAAINPVSRAETLEQKSYALYGSFVVWEEQAAKLVEQPGTSERVKTVLRKADSVAKPIADKLLDASVKVLQIRQEVSAGVSTKEQLLIAIQNLDRYVTEAGPAIKDLGKTLKEAL